MVAETFSPFATRLWSKMRIGAEALSAAFVPPPLPKPGFYTYRVTPPGGQVRLHLRVEVDGSGLLFVDVTQVIHLNSTATYMAKMALEGTPQAVALAGLHTRFRSASPTQLHAELTSIYAMVERFSNPGLGCPTCAITDLQFTDLFSTPIRAPFKADLAITYGCNNACSHCYNEPDRLDMPSLPVADWRRIIDRLSEVGVPHLIFTGGEATLHPNLPELIQYADQAGHIVGLNTNGRRMAHLPYAQTLAQAGLNHVQITLGSHVADVHNAVMNAESFQQTVRGIQSAMESGLHAITNTTLMRLNMDTIEETIDFIYALGIRTFAMNGMIYSGGGFADPRAIPEEELPALLIRVRDHAADHGMRFLWYTPTEYCRMSPVELEIGAKRCNAGEYSICIEPNGDVLPCQSFYVAAGNLLRDPWEKVWHSDLFHSFRDREVDPRASGLPEKCWECPDLPLCGGGCRIEREARDGVRSSSGGCSSGGCSTSGGGCSSGGCSTSSAPVDSSFIPLASLTDTTVRSGGNLVLLS